MPIRACLRVAAPLSAALCLLGIASPPAGASSLYSGPGPKPGPPLLYWPAADAPQLQDTGVWHAPPILISGASAYRDGEFLYQDYLYDDHGANGGQRDSNDPWSNGGSFAEGAGTYTYPNDRRYADNGADLVEFRVKPLADATAFRITLNSLVDPSLVGGTIAIGSSPAPLPVPFGADAVAPAQMFLTWHGTVGTLQDALTGRTAAVAPRVSVDPARRQFQILVPHSDWDPGTGTVRLAAGVGLWDAASNRYLIPQKNRDATHPGGAGTLAKPEAFFNVAFRYHEPWSNGFGASALKDNQQAQVLATGNLSPFYATVDFAKLLRGVNDDMPGQPDGVPETGPMDRILASHFETEQGVDFSHMCEAGSSILADYPYWYHCDGQLRGRLQPYAIYVPHKPMPAGGYGLTLLLHGASSSYNEFSDTRHQSQFGERGPGSIVITPEARGPDGFYFGAAEADVFEVWADVARHYHLDPGWTAIGGYSMGGYGTWKLADSFPDLFARASAVVGGEANSYLLASMRNVPIMMWETPTDELSWAPIPANDEQALQQLGYRFEFDWFEPAEHLAFAFNDQYAPAAAFLGTARVDRDPPHVTFVATPAADQVPSPSETNPALDAPTTFDRPALGLVQDHAYWLSDIRVRDPKVGVVPTAQGGGLGGPPYDLSPNGVIDAFSHGFGLGDPKASGAQLGAGVLTGGNIPAMAYARHYETWGKAPGIRPADELDIFAKNIASVTVWPTRAHVSCAVRLQVQSDGPIAIHLAGCGPAVRFAAGGSARRARTLRLALSVTPRRVYSRTWVTLHFRVTDPGPRAAVAGALVRIDGRQVRTDRRGDAQLRIRFASQGRFSAMATKAGFGSSRATVTAARRQPGFTG